MLGGPLLGSTEVFKCRTQRDPVSEGAQRRQGNEGRTARTWIPRETGRYRETLMLQRNSKVYKAA